MPIDTLWEKLDRIAEMNTGATVTNYITISGAENPEDFANRLVRQMQLKMRTV